MASVARQVVERPARVRKEYDVRRGEIVRAAIGLIGTRGYNATTVQMLAESCGMTKAGWLHYFASKDEMLNALLDELEERDTALLSPIVAAGLSGDAQQSRAAMLTLLDMIVAQFVECPELGRFAVVLQCESIDPDHPAHERFLSREALALDVFAQLLAASSAEPMLLARHLHAVMIGLAQQWLRTSEGFDLRRAWRDASALVLPGARSDTKKAKEILHDEFG